jgi:ribulose-5-phosphate 4-epimerase/fuculose-1-phosphate aldolase
VVLHTHMPYATALTLTQDRALDAGEGERILERACMAQVISQSTGRPLKPADSATAAHVASQMQSERLQSELFFEALRRTV